MNLLSFAWLKSKVIVKDHGRKALFAGCMFTKTVSRMLIQIPVG